MNTDKYNLIPEDMKARITTIASIVGKSEDDWRTIKWKIHQAISNEYRGLFTKKDPHTRQIQIGEFDKQVMELWQELTGVYPVVRPPKWRVNGGGRASTLILPKKQKYLDEE